MKDRAFGVEVECGVGTNNLSSIGRLWDGLRAAEREGKVSREWRENYGHDGTYIELRSPILEGRPGFTELRRAMKIIVKCGGYVTRSDGMHVHHNAPDYLKAPEKVLQLVKTWHAHRSLISAFVEPRRAGAYACIGWSPEYISRFENIIKTNPDRVWDTPERNDLNLRSLHRHKSIEIRLHEGCLDPDRAEAWVRFGQSFLNKVMETDDPFTVDRHEVLLRKLKVSQAARRRLLARAWENGALAGYGVAA